MTKDGVTNRYKYNELNQLTSSVENKDGKETSNKTYTYDANGNQTKEKDSITNVTVENTYDVDNRLSTSITVNGTKEVVNQENLYNGNGKRIQKKEGNNVVNYFYQDGVVLYTLDKDGNKTSQNFLGIDGNIIGTTRYSSEGFKYYTYNKDVQGSTTSVVGKDGTSPVTYDYDDFGVTTTIGDSSFFNEVRYTGGIYDVSTGLYYLNARYYDPNNGRFITQDTYRGERSEPETLHLYAYCTNNPINYVDPSGNSPFGFLSLSDYYKMHRLVQNAYKNKLKRLGRKVVTERYIRKYKKANRRGYLDIYDVTKHSFYEVKTELSYKLRYPKIKEQIESYRFGTVATVRKYGSYGPWVNFKDYPRYGSISYNGKIKYGLYDVKYRYRSKGVITYEAKLNRQRAAVGVMGVALISALALAPQTGGTSLKIATALL